MPELPEVETVRRGLENAVVGRRVERVELRRPDLRIPIPPELPGRMQGARIGAVGRRAKYLLFHLDNGYVALAHLGMSGRMKIHPAMPNRLETHDHVLIGLESGQQVVLHDPRRFGLLTGCTEAELAGHPLLAHLGPEPLEAGWNSDYLYRNCQRRAQAIKPVLMDQKLVVGVGNIYASEALFQAKILPERSAKTLRRSECGKLAEAVCAVLGAAIEAGGSTLRDYADVKGEAGYFQHRFSVYGREGKPCHICGRPVRRAVQAGRATYWCAKCQK